MTATCLARLRSLTPLNNIEPKLLVDEPLMLSRRLLLRLAVAARSMSSGSASVSRPMVRCGAGAAAMATEHVYSCSRNGNAVGSEEAEAWQNKVAEKQSSRVAE